MPEAVASSPIQGGHQLRAGAVQSRCERRHEQWRGPCDERRPGLCSKTTCSVSP